MACQTPVEKRSRCEECYKQYQREWWANNRDLNLAKSRENYQKHAEKRRSEALIHKAENREYYTLAEWFRKKGIPTSHIPKEDMQALIEMKKAIKLAKSEAKK